MTTCPACAQHHIPSLSNRLLVLCSTVYHFLRLYIVGFLELLRQLFSSHTTPPPYCPPCSPSSATRPIVILSGATSGIGRELLQTLSTTHRLITLSHPSHTAPSPTHANIPVDLSSPQSINHACLRLKVLLETYPASHTAVLFYCAGLYYPPAPTCAASIAATFTVNVVAPTLLLHHLHSHLHAIIYTGSASHRAAMPLSTHCPVHAVPSPLAAYPMSKLAAIITLVHHAHLLDIPVMIIHPGVVTTGLYRYERGLIGWLLRAVVRLVAWNVTQSTRRILYVVAKAGVMDSDANHLVGMPSYWDAVTLGPSPLPWQATHSETRRCTLQWLERQLASCSADNVTKDL